MEKTLKEAIEKNRQAVDDLVQALEDCMQQGQAAQALRDEVVKLRIISGGRKER